MSKFLYLYLIVVVVLLAVFHAVTLVNFGLNKKNVGDTDIVSYVLGANIVKDGLGKQLYNIDTQLNYQNELIDKNTRDYLLPYRNLPILAVVFIPFTFIDVYYTWVIFVLINLLILAVILYTQAKDLTLAQKVLIIFGTFAFPPILATLILGQLSIILLALFVLVYKQIKNQNWFLVGVASGLLFIKLPFILAIPFIFLMVNDGKGKIVFLKGLAITLGFLLLGSIIISGPQFVLNYPAFIKQTEVAQYGSYHSDMFSMGAILLNKGVAFNVMLAINLVVYLTGLGLFYVYNRRLGLNKSFAFMLVVTVLCGVHVLLFDLSPLIISVCIIGKGSITNND